MGESLLIIATLGMMIVSLLLILLPVVPLSALEWSIAMFFGLLTNFERLTPTAAVIVTVLMVIGATAGLWMPFFGLKAKQLSCMGLFAFFIGTILGQMFIPIPFVGMVIGGVVAVVVIEYLLNAQWRDAVTSGGAALKLMIYGMIAEGILAVAIIGVVIVSIVTTG